MCLLSTTLKVSSIWRCLTYRGDVRRALKQAQLHLGNQFCTWRLQLTQRATARTRKTSNTFTQAVYCLRKLLSYWFATWKLKLKDFVKPFFGRTYGYFGVLQKCLPDWAYQESWIPWHYSSQHRYIVAQTAWIWGTLRY